MQPLQILRQYCREILKVKPNLLSLLKALIVLSNHELGEILFLADFSLQRFKEILDHHTGENIEEENLVREVVKKFENPTGFHLLLMLCESNVPLGRDLKYSGLNIQTLKEDLNNRLARSNRKLVHNDEFQRSLLTDIKNIFCN
jgi:hypothetical protein